MVRAERDKYYFNRKICLYFPFIFFQSSGNGEDEEKLDENNGKENMDKAVETSNAEDNDAITNTPHKRKLSTKKPIKKSRVGSTSSANVPVLEEAVNLLKSIQSNKKEKNEYQLFGEQVAIKLRNITSPQAWFAAQQIINKTLFEAETGMVVNSYNSQPMFHQQTCPNMYPPQNVNYQSQLSPYPPPRFPTLISPNLSSFFTASQSSTSTHSESTTDNLFGQNTCTENEYQELIFN